MNDQVSFVRAELRNEINSICGLPSELLGIIGSHLGPQDRLEASCVSRHLYKSLVGNRLLWSNIDCDNPHLAFVFLKRSEQSLLNVSIRRSNLGTSLLQSLRKSAGRIETLSITLYSPRLKEVLHGASLSVKTLEIGTRGGVAQISIQNFPVLETLTIRGDPVTSHTPCLTRFTFTGELNGHERITRFLSFLSECPQLTELAVTHGPVAEGNGPVKFKNLRTYTDHTTSLHYDLGLYGLLSLPEQEKCSVIFMRNGVGYPHHKFPELPPSVTPERIRFKTTLSRRLDTSQGEVEECADGLLEIVDSTTGNRFCSTAQSSLWSNTPSTPMNQINRLYLPSLRTFDTKDTKTLCIEEHVALPMNTALFLDSFPNLKTLILSCRSVTAHLSALAPPRSFFEKLRCPVLESVIVCDQYDEGVQGRLLQVLAGIARKRQIAGCPFKLVRFFSPESRALGSPETVEELRGLVANGNFKLKEGSRARDWNVDKYFLEGLRLGSG